jgi:hypothetical protein
MFPRVQALAGRLNSLPLKLPRRVVAISRHDASAAQPHMGPVGLSDSRTAKPRPDWARHNAERSALRDMWASVRRPVDEVRFESSTSPGGCKLQYH